MRPQVREAFDEALQVVGDLTHFDALLHDSFTVPSTQARVPSDTTVQLVGSRDALRALGTSVILQRLVEAFEQGVAQWYQQLPETPDSGSASQLEALCATYDAIREYIPLYQLETLIDLAALRDGGYDDLDPQARASRIRSTFDGLGARIRRAALT
jgi:hypothetical protein